MRFSFSKKLLVLFGVPLILIGVVLTTISTNILGDNLNTEIQKELQLAADSVNVTYSKVYKGDYSLEQGGRLLKGDEVISREYDLIDAITDAAGIEITFFYEDRIVITNLKNKDGIRAGNLTGRKMEPEVYEKILQKETVFTEAYTFTDVTYYGYFTPLINSDGSVVGSIFAGRPADLVKDQINSELSKIIVPTVVIILLFMVVIILFAHQLSRRMTGTKKFLEKVADGYLSGEEDAETIRSRDEIGDIYKMSVTLRSELNKIVSNIKDTTNSLSDSSQGLLSISGGASQDVASLKSSVEDIVRDANEQADKAAQSVENIHNINAQIEYISQEMNDMYETVTAVSTAEREATQIMEELNGANQIMMETIGKIANQITVTNNSVQQIQKTIDMIRTIADETDLLAINASIEAAHAGAAGKGFAVIAEQIIKLASMSADNAGEVEKTLFSIRVETDKMVRLMEETKEQMDTQSDKMRQTVEKFSMVAQGVESSLTNVESVNSSMETLDASKETVLDIVRRFTDISNQFVTATDAMMENTNHMTDRMREMEETAGKLDEISQSLSSGLDNFKL